MIDVHPPHHPLSGWKDFWIHLGTITAGLLIAICLEQSVEALHRVHQRHQLERDLHAEAVRNTQILQHDLQVLQAARDYTLTLKAYVDALRHGVAPSSLTPVQRPQSGDPFLPSAGAWASARDSSQLYLLPREQTSMYEELYAQRDFLLQATLELFKAQDDIGSFSQKVQDTFNEGAVDPVRLTPAERDEFSALLGRLAVKTDGPIGDMRFYEAENNAVVQGAETVDELHQSVNDMDAAKPASTIGDESTRRKKP
jgi:hypothetical protein